METAGLVLGVASVTALFSSCVQFWGYISTAQSFSEEFTILQIKLDVEKALFLQWGRRIGLITLEGEEGEVDHRITDNSEKSQEAIIHVLLCLKKLLTNTEELHLKYGIESEQPMAQEHKDQGLEKVSYNLMETFEMWQDKIKRRQCETSIWRKTRWACRDKDKFVAFINEISYFNEKLHRLTPISDYLQRMMVRQTIEVLRDDLPTLYLIRDASKTRRLRDWSDAASEQISASEGLPEHAETTTEGSSFERINAWREKSGIDLMTPEKRTVDPNVLDLLTKVETLVAGFGPKMQQSKSPSVRDIAKSGVCTSVLLKLQLLHASLKERQFTPEQLAILRAALSGWAKQVVEISRTVNWLSSIKWLRVFSWSDEAKDLSKEIETIPTTLSFFITNTTENSP